MSLMEILQPYLTSPMWVSLGFTILMIMFLPILIRFARPDIWYNFFHVPYWYIYFLDGETVLKRRIIKKDLKNLKIKSIEDKPYTWIIREDSSINFKSGSIIFLDIKSCVSISLESEEYKQLFKEVKEEKDKRKIIAKIPIINRFYLSKLQLHDTKKMAGFATKIQANPEFIINAVTLHIFLKQKFTQDIIKVPKSLYEILEENLSLIVIASVICIVLFLILQKTPNL